MGFGILFIGWFLLLNLFYHPFTDVICALILTYACYKLGTYQKYFRHAGIVSALFTVFGLGEFVLSVIAMFAPTSAVAELMNNSFPLWLTLPRYFILIAFSSLAMLGIYALGKEVDAVDVYGRAKRCLPFTLGVYGIGMLLEIPLIQNPLGSYAVVISLFVTVLTLVMLAFHLVVIYHAYMRICLPKDLLPPTKTEAGTKHEEEE